MSGGRGIAILEHILERASRVAEQAEVYHVSRVETPVQFEANRVKSIETRETVAAALRVVKDGRIGFSSSSNLRNVEGLVQAALETVPYGAEARFQFPGATRYAPVPVYDESVAQMPLEAMVQLGQSLVDAVRRYTSEVLLQGTVSRVISTTTLLNSAGGRFEYSKTTHTVAFEGTVVRGEDMLFVFDFESSCHPVVDVSPLVDSIVRQLEQARRTAAITTGPMPVVFMPSAVAEGLLFPLALGFSGQTVVQGTSPLVGRLGEAVADQRFSLVDDTTLPFVPGSRLSDDEGVPSRRLPLIDGGVAANFLYDLQTAGQAGTASTGSGERAFSFLPGPSAGVLLVQEGDAGWQDLLSEMKEGLVVERLLGAGQSNILGGDFNANVLLGYKVEAGEVVGRVKNTVVSGNVYRALNSLIGIGRDGRWVGGGFFAPPLAFAGLEVASKQ